MLIESQKALPCAGLSGALSLSLNPLEGFLLKLWRTALHSLFCFLLMDLNSLSLCCLPLIWLCTGVSVLSAHGHYFPTECLLIGVFGLLEVLES